MHARDLTLPAQPPFCCFFHRSSFHFLNWQFRLRVEAGVVPSTQGLLSCAKSGLRGYAFPYLEVLKVDIPHWGQSLHQGSCPLPSPRYYACSRAKKLASPTPLNPQHTHFGAAWTKESILLGSLSALLGTCLSPPPSSLPCLSSTSHQGHHTHRGTSMHTLTVTYTYTCNHTQKGKQI